MENYELDEFKQRFIDCGCDIICLDEASVGTVGNAGVDGILVEAFSLIEQVNALSAELTMKLGINDDELFREV